MTKSNLQNEVCESCKTAVQRAYYELRRYGVEDRPAFEAAVNVLALRHPERDLRAYQDVVAKWLTDDEFHDSPFAQS